MMMATGHIMGKMCARCGVLAAVLPVCRRNKLQKR
jgi:hypothetical protein